MGGQGSDFPFVSDHDVGDLEPEEPPLPPWLGEDAVAPLVEAYETRIKDLEAANKAHAERLSFMKSRMETLLEVWFVVE